MTWLAHSNLPPKPVHRPWSSIVFRLVITLVLTLVGHDLLMADEGIHVAITAVQGAAAGATHAHCTDLAGTCDLRPAPELTDSGNPRADDACGGLTPWKPTGGDSGVRLDRVAPLTAAPSIAKTSCPVPDAPTHLDPPGVRRAFLQVYLN